VCSAQYNDTRECECPLVACDHCNSIIRSCLCPDHAEACRETPTPCACCGHEVPRSRIAQHFERECDAFIVACPACNLFMPRHAVGHHLPLCAIHRTRCVPAHTPIGCPLRTVGCLARGDLAHISSCSRYVVVCPCGVDVPRGALDSHRDACDVARRPVELLGLTEAAGVSVKKNDRRSAARRSRFEQGGRDYADWRMYAMLE